jgi:hypothetical protein
LSTFFEVLFCLPLFFISPHRRIQETPVAAKGKKSLYKNVPTAQGAEKKAVESRNRQKIVGLKRKIDKIEKP